MTNTTTTCAPALIDLNEMAGALTGVTGGSIDAPTHADVFAEPNVYGSRLSTRDGCYSVRVTGREVTALVAVLVERGAFTGREMDAIASAIKAAQ